jgi:hypothetical protein
LRNKARLMAQGHTRVEGLDFDETFAPNVILESIQILHAYAPLTISSYIKWM